LGSGIRKSQPTLSDVVGNKMTMLLAHEQEPEAVLARLRPLVPLLYRAVEAGIGESLSFFGMREQPICSVLQPNLVRWKAKQILDEAGHMTRLEEDNVTPIGLRFERIPIANNGLQLSFNNLFLRILKADGGGVPLAGSSRARQIYYHQLALFGEAVDLLKLLVLWDADGAGLAGELVLVCPKRSAETRDSLEVHWMVPIPHPAEDVGSTSPESGPNAGDDDNLYRLPTREEERE
jgi:hypothetical protein